MFFNATRQFAALFFLSLSLVSIIVSQQVVKTETLQVTARQQFLRGIYLELIEINTTDSVGDTTKAAEAMAVRFRAAGFSETDVRVLVHPGNNRKGNLVVRYRSPNPKAKPLLLLAHIDVVEARKEDWSDNLDPFKLTERDGYFYGRGTADDKAMAAIFVANLIDYKQKNAQFDRDIILALTADEEGGDFNGAKWLIDNHRDLVSAEFGINEGGGGRHRKGVKLFNGVQASEKVYQSFLLEVKNKGGHSSLPSKDNAIYQLAAAIDRLSKFDFPVNLNEVTRGYFQKMSAIETGATAADMKAVSAMNTTDANAVKRLSVAPYYNALMRTTCVATKLEAGHAENALPQTARATVNCRILPQENANDVQRKLIEVLADDRISITFIKEPKPSQPSPLTSEVMRPIEEITRALWKDVPVVPIMGTGATDSLYFRQVGIPMYGVSGIFSDIDDNRAHGRDERLGVREFYDGQEFLDKLVKSLAGQKTTAIKK
ncbi:MAG: Acetylornithine deacetylase/Succinyl-diaminopimelate desuccinylase and related deacylases [uncultured Pyrinomonadaceae bacterium]|uniref:Acetylornithine deacetylase/Succinyl-diaminopimelate desuccinylase and related deacylases n=1 Tax=uncultured Pyrinomonadaceae bacterium TaxID=2283094 RepID=A0A6J4PUA0_9BACT|nr:MAG: Acetylornithine deacetylase/Succinyl-diaminopimelate desuccinylase and related deacylases [uncultured Pyrinomonadaceae bacterium]